MNKKLKALSLLQAFENSATKLFAFFVLG